MLIFSVAGMDRFLLIQADFNKSEDKNRNSEKQHQFFHAASVKG